MHYREAKDLEGSIAELIRGHHQHLIEANIAILYRADRWIERGRAKLGKAIIVPALWRKLTDYDLAIVVNERAYRAQSVKKQLAILDNLLCYFKPPVVGPDGLSYATRDPDITEFSDIIRRHKVCFTNIPAVMADQGSDQLQKVEYEHPETSDVEEEIDNYEIVEADGDFASLQDYDDIDDTGCTVKTLATFD